MVMTKVKLRVGTKRRELTTVTTMVITIVQYRRPIVASYEARRVGRGISGIFNQPEILKNDLLPTLNIPFDYSLTKVSNFEGQKLKNLTSEVGIFFKFRIASF